MNAKTLLEILHPDNSTAHWTISDKEIKNTILFALDLAAAVEGPPDSTPETDAAWADDKGHRFQVSASLECRMLNALRALKAERERAGKMAENLECVHEHCLVREGDAYANLPRAVIVRNLLADHAALAAQEGRHD